MARSSKSQERTAVRNFWNNLSLEQRKKILCIDKESLLKKIKEKHRHICSCSVCGRKRAVINQEMERLFANFIQELEFHAQHESKELLLTAPKGQAKDIVKLNPMRNQDLERTGSKNHTISHKVTKLLVQKDISSLNLRPDDINGMPSLTDDETDLSSQNDDLYDSSSDESDVSPEEMLLYRFGLNLRIQNKKRILLSDEWIKNFGPTAIQIFNQFEKYSSSAMSLEELLSRPSKPTSYRRTTQITASKDSITFSEECTFEGSARNSEDEDRSSESEDHDFGYSETLDDVSSSSDYDTIREEKKWRESKRMFRYNAAKLFYQKIVLAYRELEAMKCQKELIDTEEKLDQQRKKKQKKRNRAKKNRKKQEQDKQLKKIEGSKEQEEKSEVEKKKELEQQRILKHQQEIQERLEKEKSKINLEEIARRHAEQQRKLEQERAIQLEKELEAEKARKLAQEKKKKKGKKGRNKKRKNRNQQKNNSAQSSPKLDIDVQDPESVISQNSNKENYLPTVTDSQLSPQMDSQILREEPMETSKMDLSYVSSFGQPEGQYIAPNSNQSPYERNPTFVDSTSQPPVRFQEAQYQPSMFEKRQPPEMQANFGSPSMWNSHSQYPSNGYQYHQQNLHSTQQQFRALPKQTKQPFPNSQMVNSFSQNNGSLHGPPFAQNSFSQASDLFGSHDNSVSSSAWGHSGMNNVWLNQDYAFNNNSSSLQSQDQNSDNAQYNTFLHKDLWQQ